MNLKDSTKRVFYFDALRALAIIGIVCCHVAAKFALKTSLINTDSYYFISFVAQCRDFSIPIFVMLSGALLLNKNMKLTTFIKKRFNRVFVPYIFWCIIFIIFSIIFLHTNDLNTILNIITGEHGTIGVIFWFIWMILIVYILIFIINSVFLKKSEEFNMKFIKICVILFLIYSLLVGFKLINFDQNKLIFYSSFIGYAILGYYLANTNFTKGKIANLIKLTPTKIVILTLSISVLLYLSYIIFNVVPSSIELNKSHGASYFNIILLILSSSIFLLFRYFFESNKITNHIEKGIIGKIINSISKHSFGIYFIHYIFIRLFHILTKKELLIKNPIKAIPLLLIIVFLSSWFIAWIIGKIPYLNKISGVN